MATKIARADGNLTTAATWGAVDATSLLDSEAANTASTTAYVESSGFTPGAITIDGIAVKIRSRSSSPTGTFSIRLAQAGATVAGTEVTVNASDVPTAAQDESGWFLVKFTGVLLVAATVYTVSIKTSVNSTVTLYRDATAGNWARMLRTTTTGAPGAGDNWFVLGEWTAAGTKTTRTMNPDTTAATDFGGASTTLASFGVSSGGVVTCATAAATTYILQLSGRMLVWYGGILNTGTASSKMPRDSKLTIQFDCAVDGDFGLTCYGTHVGRGQSRSSGKDVVQTVLTADLAAAGTTLTVAADTGWLNGDDIAIAATGTSSSQGETKTLNANAGASSMTISAGVANAHLGTSPRQAEVALLTRNVVIRAVTAGTVAYVYYGNQATVDLEWIEFRYLGTASSPKRGIEIDVTTGSLSMNYCSHRDFDNNGIYMTNAAWNNCTIANHVAYHTNTSSPCVRLSATTGSTWSFTDCCFIGSTTGNSDGIQTLTARGTIARCRISGFVGSGISYATTFDVGLPGWTTLEIHSCTNGVNFSAGNLKDFGSLLASNIWHNTVGINFGSSGGPSAFVVESCNLFGNSDNVIFATLPGGATFRTCTFNGTTAVAAARGIKLNQSNSYYRIRCENCVFGLVSGIKTAHTTGDIDVAGSPMWLELTLVNTNLASATEIANQTNAVGLSKISYEKVDQVSGVNKTVYPALGTVAYETTVYRTASPSEKLTPSGATSSSRLKTSIKRARVSSGATLAIACYVRKDSSYTGSAPRLVMRANAAVGFTADVVVATFSAAADTWQQLTGTTATPSENGVAEFYVDCDGSAGNVYVDDWLAV